MREASMTEIKDLWLKRSWKPNDDFHLYISSPFCRVACTYCVYKGKLINPKNEEDMIAFNEYYDEYLPALIDEFAEVIQSRELTSVYFGGGTPNLMSAELMRKVFDRIPGFKDIRVKAIDLNPVYITKEQIDVMAEYGFTTFCWGVQSFDPPSLKNHERSFIPYRKFKEIVDYTKSKGIYQSADIICYLKDYNENDIEVYKKDMQLCFDLGLDFVTAAADFHAASADPSLSRRFIDATEEVIQDEAAYKHERDIAPSYAENSIKPIIRAIRNEINSKDFYETVLCYYGSTDFPEAASNVLALGDDTSMYEIMSYWPRELFYITKRKFGKPAFYIVYENILSVIKTVEHKPVSRSKLLQGEPPSNTRELRQKLNLV